jgi:uncharacterized membrane protein YvlD (DUF360 family)
VGRFQGRRAVARTLAVWIITAVALLALGWVSPTVEVSDVSGALEASLAIGLVNALLWPLLIRFALPFTVLTLGLGALVLNGLVVRGVSAIVPGFDVGAIGSGIVVAIWVTVVTTAVTALMAIDDDDFHYRNFVERRARRTGALHATDVPGVIFLEIDGLAHAVLQRAVRDGNVPTIARWLREGTHRLHRWETDWSSQTGACQAGLLHGDNDDMPAFRWWEKDRGRAIVTNHPRDAAELERRHSDGRGLLHEDGASRANILSGDAVHSLLTMSTVLDRDRPGRIGQDYYTYFARPYNVIRTMLLMTIDIVQELFYAAQQRRRDIRPRVKRDFRYALVRAWGTIIQRDLQVQAVIGDIMAGRPVVYTTFLAYDEVAHHSGVERPDALATLRRVDHEFARLEAALPHAPRPYRFVVLSDHGQSQGATFRDRYGTTLEEVVRAACEPDAVVAGAVAGDEASGYLDASLAEASQADNAAGRTVRAAAGRRLREHRLEAGPDEEAGDGPPPPELVVMASGNLGLVSFPREPGRLTHERIRELHPRLLPALREHPGIGFVLVRSQDDGAVVLGARGARFLDDGRVEGEDPLAPFGPNAARHVRRTDRFPHCADLMLNSTFWADTDEVAAFEELVGSHGGLGGEQGFPFLLAPVELEVPREPLIGAEEVHRVLRKWLRDLGHTGYEDAITPPLTTSE